MDRVRFIEHRGRQVLLIDYSGLDDEQEILRMLEDRKRLVAEQPRGSLLTLTDISDAHFTRDAITRIKEVAVYDHPHVRRSALVGAETSTPKGGSEAISTFTVRTWERFQTREEALDWLVAEETTGDAPRTARVG